MVSDIPFEPDDAPPFAEPWHGMVFALTMKTAQNGHFTWPEWGQKFASNLARHSAAGSPKDASHYYDIWLETFEDILDERGLAGAKELGLLKQAWTEAYLHTPHGDPVILDRD